MDSIHFENDSLMDKIVSPLMLKTESTYSAPFATHAYIESTFILADGKKAYGFPPLTYVHGDAKNLIVRLIYGFSMGLISGFVLLAIFLIGYAWWQKQNWYKGAANIFYGKTQIAWRVIWIAFLTLWVLINVWQSF